MPKNIQLTMTLRRKIGNFIGAKLRIITQKTDSQKALRTVPPVRSPRHNYMHFQDGGSYMEMTY